MDFAIWAYPWDLIDEGVETVVDRLMEIGVSEINLATNYHSVQPFLPHNPERRTFFAQASSYFHPNEDRYGSLTPVPNESMDEADWLARIDNELDGTQVSLNSWTIGCHNSRLGLANPELTLESPYGDSLAFGLCPSKPEVQRYLTGLLADLSDRASFKRIGLETFDCFYGTGFGWHHDKYHVELGRLGEFLFGLCFCEACREQAAKSGVEVGQARESARGGIEAIIDGTISPSENARRWIRTRPELAAYVTARFDTLTELYQEFQTAVGSDVSLGRYTGFFDVEDAWMHGVDLDAVSDPLDFQTVIAYESSRESAVHRIETADRRTTDIPLHAGVLPGHPAIHDSETLTEVVDGIAAAGVDRISFYNYGMLPERNLRWIREATEPYR